MQRPEEEQVGELGRGLHVATTINPSHSTSFLGTNTADLVTRGPHNRCCCPSLGNRVSRGSHLTRVHLPSHPLLPALEDRAEGVGETDPGEREPPAACSTRPLSRRKLQSGKAKRFLKVLATLSLELANLIPGY